MNSLAAESLDGDLGPVVLALDHGTADRPEDREAGHTTRQQRPERAAHQAASAAVKRVRIHLQGARLAFIAVTS